MAYIRVTSEFVVKNAKSMILKIQHQDAISANAEIDRLMQKKTLFGRKPVHQTHTECISSQDNYHCKLFQIFLSTDQLDRCQRLLFAAQKSQDGHVVLSTGDLSSLGYNTSSGDVKFLQHFWDTEPATQEKAS
jgi:hypothetical protein